MAVDTATMDIISDDSNAGNEDYYFTGVPTTPKDLYVILFFFLVLYLVGDCFCSRVLKIVPSLVGYILVGIAFGPEGFDLLRIGGNDNNDNNNCGYETLVLLGNIGLVLLIVQAGLEMEYETLRMVGLRGVVIAIIGTVLPVTIGTAIASRYLENWKSALAAGCSFGPTSAGIAMNVLGQCRILASYSEDDLDNSRSSNQDNGDNNNKEETILHLPVGQLIVAAAIVDDILALVVLSQLQALRNDGETTENMALDIAVPIVSAVLWLVAGGAIALWVFPRVLEKVLNGNKFLKDSNSNGNISLVVLVGLLYVLLLGTYFSRASYLLGAFLSGLAFCRDTSRVDELFRMQFQGPLDYLMKLFFAASIGFQVPVRSFGDTTIIGRGCFFALALLGKLVVGLLTPNFYKNPNNNHNSESGNLKGAEKRANNLIHGKQVRDCLVVGFSMMGEAEFAFVVAVYGVSEGLVPPDVYASIVWAILLSTVISPLLLKSTLAFFPYRSTGECETPEKKEDWPMEVIVDA